MSTNRLSWPARLGYLVFLWTVLALLTWLVAGKMLPHVLGIPVLGWCLGPFMLTVFVSMYLAAVQMTRRLLTGRYPEAGGTPPAAPGVAS
jgi:hypothetical protein